MRHASPNRIDGDGFADYLKMSALALALAAVMLAVGLHGGAQASYIQDPVEMVQVAEYVAPGAGYLHFDIGPGDPNEEQVGGSGVKILPAPLPAPLPNIQGGDEQDKPVEERQEPDYSNFTIANGDPNEESGANDFALRGKDPGRGPGVNSPEPAAAPKPNVQAGDDRDKPVEQPDYSGFTIANGDPNEEGNN